MMKVIFGIVMFLLVGVTICLFACSIGYCGTQDSIYERDSTYEKVGWTVYAADDDLSTSATLLTELDTTYTQLAVSDDVEVGSSTLADITQTVTIYGIDSEDNKATEDVALTGSTFVTTSTTWKYIDQVEVDAACLGTITIRRATGDTFITSIPIGQLDAQMSQHFNGEYATYITGWSGRCTSTTGTVLLELRTYPDDVSCLTPTVGYKVLDAIQFTNVVGSDSGIIGQPIKIPPHSWISIWGTAGTDNADASCTLEGVDIRQ
jgi:hypothetical protein